VVHAVFFTFRAEHFGTNSCLVEKISLGYYAEHLLIIFNFETFNIHYNVFLATHIDSDHLVAKTVYSAEIMVVDLYHTFEQRMPLTGDLIHVASCIVNNLQNLIVILLVFYHSGVPTVAK
jgi:hypothetical protein